MKKISSKGFKLFWPYLTAYRKELEFASLFGLVSGVTVVLMTYYIGVGVDLLIGAGEVDFSVLYRTLFLLAGILLVTVV
ncbi:MAG: ABC transporter ATP-binding protein, partial [Carnobacterium inhibens]